MLNSPMSIVYADTFITDLNQLYRLTQTYIYKNLRKFNFHRQSVIAAQKTLLYLIESRFYLVEFSESRQRQLEKVFRASSDEWVGPRPMSGIDPLSRADILLLISTSADDLFDFQFSIASIAERDDWNLTEEELNLLWESRCSVKKAEDSLRLILKFETRRTS